MFCRLNTLKLLETELQKWHTPGGRNISEGLINIKGKCRRSRVGTWTQIMSMEDGQAKQPLRPITETTQGREKIHK